MTNVDDAVMSRMKEIVLVEHRPFSYLDFKEFQVNNRHFRLAHGTFRNKISKLMKSGKIERVNNGHRGFYLLKGCYFENHSMTENHTGVNSVTNIDGILTGISNNQIDINTNYDNRKVDGIREFCNHIRNELSHDKFAVHDIHSMTQVPSIYDIVSRNPDYSGKLNKVNKGIMLEPSIVSGTKIQRAIYRTDTVTTIVGCSSMPVPFNEYGMNRLSGELSWARDDLTKIFRESADRLGAYEANPIPDIDKWNITLWHFGWDKPVGYPIKGFEMTWYDAKKNLIRCYLKKINRDSFIRRELQESPGKSFGDIKKSVDKNS